MFFLIEENCENCRNQFQEAVWLFTIINLNKASKHQSFSLEVSMMRPAIFREELY